MTVRVRARWILPIVGPAIRDGWIDVDRTRGEVVAVATAEAQGIAGAPPPDRTLDLGEAVILPGLVNAHTHLELSHLAGRVRPAPDFVTWVRAMLTLRSGTATSVGEVRAAAESAIRAAEAFGTAGLGDIGNTDVTVAPLAASSLSGVHFREALGFRAADALRVSAETRLGALMSYRQLMEQGCTRVAASVAPHAPYSTSASLIAALASGMSVAALLEDGDAPSPAVSSIHLAESRAELEFLQQGTGPFRALLSDLGAWDDGWVPPGCGPVAYLQQLGALHAHLLVVHGTQLTRAELDTIAAAGATLVLCARSNAWVGAGVPPVRDAAASSVRLALGTDSLASVEDLNLFAELAALRRIAPEVPASTLLRAATWGGAQALGLGTLGLLAPGARTRAVVRVPPGGVADVEEWLVAEAADTADLRWLDEIVASLNPEP